MSDKKNVLQMSQREKDIADIMFVAAKFVLGCDKKRVCLSPSKIRDMLKQSHPEIKVFNVVSSQKNLEFLGLLLRIKDAGTGETVGSARCTLTFEINEELYQNSNIEIILKRKTGYKAGTYKKPPVTTDKTKTTLKRAKELIGKIDAKVVVLEKESLALRKKLAKVDESVVFLREARSVIADLLAVKRRNLKKLGIIIEEKD
jgi:hypothetical protein